MAKFRKKPVVVEARWFDGRLRPDPDTDGMMDWFSKEDIDLAKWCGGDLRAQIDGWMNINTLEGVMKAYSGDWIIKGVNGEFYPCKPDIFEKTYEPVERHEDTVPLDAERVERAAKAITSIWNKPSANPTAFPASAETLARAALTAAAGSEESTMYYTATQEVYDVSGTLDTEPKYANSFNVAGGPYETVEEAVENAEEFRWIIGFRGVRPVSIRAAADFEVGDEEEIDGFRPHNLNDFLSEIVDAAITYRNAIATALSKRKGEIE